VILYRSPVVGDAGDRAVPLRPQCLETRFEFRKSSHHPDSLPVTDFERRRLEALKAELDAEYQASIGRPAAAPQPKISSTQRP
jgi:hypothetical protein